MSGFFIMAHYIKVKKAVLTPTQFGNNITISMIGEYDENDKYVKWVKLDAKVIELLTSAKIEL